MKPFFYTIIFSLAGGLLHAQVQIDQAIQLTGTGSSAKISGIEQVNSAEDATSAESIQKNTVTYAAATNSGNAFSVTLTPAPVYTTGMTVHFRASADITGSASLNVNGLGAKTIKKNYNSDLVSNDIKNGQMVSVIYDGTNFQMLSQLGNAASAPAEKAWFTVSKCNTPSFPPCPSGWTSYATYTMTGVSGQDCASGGDNHFRTCYKTF
jgi:hypothetical protein